MTFVHDDQRPERLGMPEAIVCQGKDDASVDLILAELIAKPDCPTLFTRLPQDMFDRLDEALTGELDYDPLSATGILHDPLPQNSGSIAVVTAGTSDLRVAGEAKRTLEFSGLSASLYSDVGVAGIHRLFDRIDEIRKHDVVIAVAGWDAALASVLGGLVAQPLIAVPSSVGYGVAEGGSTALNSMLASCGQGVLVTNIDNGFGAACGAIRMLNQLKSSG